MNNGRDVHVLHVTPWFPPHKSGIGNYVLNLICQLIGLRYKVSVLTVKRLMETPHLSTGNTNFGIQNIYYISCFYLPGWPYVTMRSVSVPLDLGTRINSIVKNGNFDIIHAHGIQFPVCWLAIYYAHRNKIPSVLSLHATYPILNPNKNTRIEKWLYRNVFSTIFSLANAVIGPADTITNFARKYSKNSFTAFYTVRYGLENRRFVENLGKKNTYREEFRIPANVKVLLFVGRFERIKGITEFCQAAKKVVKTSKGKVQVIVVGSGTLESEVNSIVGNTLGIHIFDWQPQEKMHQFYIASDILVVPSSSEAMPLTVLEGMNAGLHIVYSPVGGLPDTLRGYPSRTPLRNTSNDEIYGVLSQLVSRELDTEDKETSLRYAQSFTWSPVREKIVRIYDQQISNALS